MEKLRAFLKRKDIVFSAKRYFIDAMGAMAQGLFCTLLVGTILNTIGQQFHIEFLNAVIVTIGKGDGAVHYTIGGLCSAMVGPGMAVAIAGALMFMSYSGITMNIFSQIGIIMLIGLVAKNGILIVEFANQRQESGLSLPEAIRSSATQRLRPILMTSVSTILGLVPLVYATGEGAQGRIAMGVAVVGGMLVSTFLTLFIVPAMYSFISTNRKKQNT